MPLLDKEIFEGTRLAERREVLAVVLAPERAFMCSCEMSVE